MVIQVLMVTLQEIFHERHVIVTEEPVAGKIFGRTTARVVKLEQATVTV